MQPKDSVRKKQLGAFYTHQGLTDVICEWAIRSANCRVFEPSFGGCGFLRSAHDRLVSFNSVAPAKQIFGCDIDPDAFSHLASLFEGPVDLRRFHEGDFLEQKFLGSWKENFDAVIGNPPYLPYRMIDPVKREPVLKLLKQNGLELDRRASLWAYFVALSIMYIKSDGRMAWVLPSSFLHANYARDLRRYIASMFSEVRVFELQERQFLLEGTEEKTVVLLADGKLTGPQSARPSDIPLTRCLGVQELSRDVHRWLVGNLETAAGCESAVFDGLSKAPRELFLKLKSGQHCQRLGDLLKIQIGLVTGNNKFFLRNDYERLMANLSTSDLVNILPRFQYAKGLDFGSDDFASLVESCAKAYLVSAGNVKGVSRKIREYLDTYPLDEKERCSTFKKRSVWSQTDDGVVPDAFFPVMQHNGPRLVLNSASVNCTNSIHRGYFKVKVSEVQKKLISLTTLSTFSQISAEICGRSYGSGALKHEPREVEEIGVLLPPIHHRKVTSAFRKADKFLRDGSFNEASQVADQLILGALGFEDIPMHASILRSGLAQIRRNRQR